MAEKNRYWTAVVYPENMVEDWEQKIDRLLQLPYAYCKHDLDHDKKSEHRKDHVHIIMVWGNTTTAKHAYETVNRLSAPGRLCCPFVESVIGIRFMYEYLIHNTESAKKEGKELYPASARITGNGFDIGAYEQLSAKEKSDALRELCDFIIEKNTRISQISIATPCIAKNSRMQSIGKQLRLIPACLNVFARAIIRSTTPKQDKTFPLKTKMET